MVREIPAREYADRVKKVQKNMAREGIDILIAYANEAEMANVRYLSDYWPAFEVAGVAVPRSGQAALLIGPETLTFAKQRSKLKRIYQLLEFREAAEPAYPNKKFMTFNDLFGELLGPKLPKKIGIAGWPIINLPVFNAVTKAARKVKAEVLRADNVLNSVRVIKSKNEIALLRQAFRASKAAVREIIKLAKPGMTESQLVGIAQGAIYKNGAEYEGHPLYVFVGKKTTNAISRFSPNAKIKKGLPIQLNIGARVSGYSSSIGRILFFGKMPQKMRDFFKAGLDAQEYVMSITKAGVPAGEIARKYVDYVTKIGYGQYLLYGPYHGLGLMECEAPWVETSSDYLMKENMTFQADIFWHTNTYGARWEDGVVVKKSGVEVLDDLPRKIFIK